MLSKTMFHLEITPQVHGEKKQSEIIFFRMKFSLNFYFLKFFSARFHTFNKMNTFLILFFFAPEKCFFLVSHMKMKIFMTFKFFIFLKKKKKNSPDKSFLLSFTHK